jgi:RND family efflux transporter MFP subunit
MSLPFAVKWLPVSCLLLAGAVGIGCHEAPAPPANNTPSAPVARAQRTPISNQLTVAGEFLPFQEVEMHAKVAGYIRRIHVDIGDRVHTGEVLAELEVPEMTAQVDGAQAGVQRSHDEILRAQSAVDRAEADHSALHASALRLKQASEARPGLIAQQELDDAQARDIASEAQVEAARSELAAMKQALGTAQAEHRHFASLADYSRIVAPFSGIVTWRYADTGTLLQAGTSNAGSMAVVKLAQVDTLRLRLPVPENLAGFVHVGDSAQIRVQATGAQLTGKIVRTTGELDLATRTLQVEVDLPNADGKLTPGMYAEVTLRIQRSGNALTIPVEAVDRSQNTPAALIVNAHGQVERRTLSLGLETPNAVEVTGGLQEGEYVIVGNLSSFHNGEQVEAREIVSRAAQSSSGKE